MKLTDKNTGETLEVSLRYFRGGFNPDLNPCCLADLASGELQGCYDAATDGYMVDDLQGFIDWWTDEAEKANADPEYQGDGLLGITEDCKERGDEWCLIISK